MNIKFWLFSLTVLSVLLQGCSGDSGGGASDREAETGTGSGNTGFIYSGPAPASTEIQSFKLSFYDNLVLTERCGSCHTPGGSGPTHFVDNDDVNNAWQQANTVVDLEDPAASAVVQRVANGHNCWLGNNQTATCAITMTGYIEAWAAGAQTSVSEISLVPVAAVSPAATLITPAYENLDSSQSSELRSVSPEGLLYLLNIHCSDCHADVQSPFFASADTETAYNSVLNKIDLNTPSNSRVVQRLRNDFHNCWSNDCQSDADDIQAAVARFADLVDVTEVDDDLVISMAQVLDTHGIVASTGGRFEDNVIAKWEFREGIGNLIADTSGVQPEVPLTLSGEYEWLGGWGVTFVNGQAMGATSGSSKLRDLITGTGEFSIEAWVAPNNVSQENAWIAGYAGGPMSRNFLLTQNLYDYDFYNRSSVTADNSAGDPALSTDDDAEFAQATLQHVVVTFDPVDGRKIYVNGEYTGDIDEQGGGTLEGWNNSFAMVLANSTANNAPWAGVMRMVAVHNRSLTPEQIQNNFEIGVGARYFLLFSVSEILDREGECHIGSGSDRTNYCYVVFEVSQFDASSYLFNEPFFISLNQNFTADGFDIRGIHIGINGRLAEVGQGYVNVNATVNADNYSAEGQQLSSIGTIIGLELGSDQDMFFLSFDEIDGQFDATTPQTPLTYSSTLDGVAASDIGFRTFEAIHTSYSAITGVPVSNSTVSTLFSTVKQAMPVTADFQAYLASHQMAVTQLAMGYCSALVDDITLRDGFFNDGVAMNFSTQSDLVSDSDWETKVIQPLLDAAFSINGSASLDSQPARSAVQAELLSLIIDNNDFAPYDNDPPFASNPDGDPDGLARCNGSCSGVISTEQVVKAVCGSVLGSAAVLLQ